MHVTATQAKNRFGAICTPAKTEPVFVEKDGRIDTVIVSAQQFEAFAAARQTQTPAQRKKQFERTYRVWIDAQNARLEKCGLWCDDMRVW